MFINELRKAYYQPTLFNLKGLFENFLILLEPVLSTGVYIHPSGYSYTVAPNGVWYFHNADGKPPTQIIGSPPMSYTKKSSSPAPEQPRVMQRPSSTGSSTRTCESISPTSMMDNSSMGLPLFRSVPPPDMQHVQTTQLLQTQAPYQVNVMLSVYRQLPRISPPEYKPM